MYGVSQTFRPVLHPDPAGGTYDAPSEPVIKGDGAIPHPIRLEREPHQPDGPRAPIGRPIKTALSERVGGAT